MIKNEKQLIKSLRELGSTITLDPSLEAQSRKRILSYYQESFTETGGFDFYLYFKPITASLIILFLLAGSFGTVCLAQNTVPGSLLYPIKRTAEKTRLIMAFSSSQKTVLRAEIISERLDEVKILAQRVEQGETGANKHLDSLTQDVQKDLKTLRKDIIARTTIFNEEELLKEEAIIIEKPENGDLPVIDDHKIYTVIQTEELKKMLEETKTLLKEENLEVALLKIDEAKKIEPTQIIIIEEEDLKDKESKKDSRKEIDLDDSILEQPVQPATDQEDQPIQIIPTQPIPSYQPIRNDADAETKIKEGVSTGLIREVPVKTDIIREE